MREIKFRAWDNVKDRMYSVGEEDDVVFSIESNGIAAIDITEDVDEFKTLHHLEYMQFTGLVDKNGVEIYEGDIIDYGADYSVVRYEDGCFWSRLGQYQLYNHNKNDIEVLGNIYEHPHLLQINNYREVATV